MKDTFTVGLEKILNNPNTSFIQNPHVFNEIHKNSNMSMSSMIKHIGRMEQAIRKKKEPSDNEKSQKRLHELESKSSD